MSKSLERKSHNQTRFFCEKSSSTMS